MPSAEAAALEAGAATLGADSEHSELTSRVLGTGFLLGIRRLIGLVVTALSTVVVARELGATPYGAYASALGLAQLLTGISDFGFSLTLGRDLAQKPNLMGRLVRAALRVQTAWSLILTAGIAGAAISAGLGTTRGQVLLALAPMVTFYSLSVVRAYFGVRFDVRLLATVDVLVGIVSGAGMIAIAISAQSALGVALVFSATTIIGNVIIARVGLRRMDPQRPSRADLVALTRRVLPLGFASILSSFYFTIDLAILGWLVEGPQLGQYALAVKILSLLVALPTMIMTAAMPGLSMTAASRQRISQLAATLLKTMAVTCLPVCVGTILFASTVVRLAGGSEYAHGAYLVAIMAGAGVVSTMGNVLGASYIALHLIRPQLISNTVALVFNVAGNVILAPRYGVGASAWLTLATELLVGTWALAALRKRMDFRLMARAIRPALLACVAMVPLALALHPWPALAIPASAAAFLLVTTLLHGWPEEFGLPGRLRAARRMLTFGRA